MDLISLRSLEKLSTSKREKLIMKKKGKCANVIHILNLVTYTNKKNFLDSIFKQVDQVQISNPFFDRMSDH